MKYLVNRETKEHVKKGLAPLWLDESPDWKVVEADPEGWIPWSGGECPLPDDCEYAFRFRSNDGSKNTQTAFKMRWEHKGGMDDVTAYRPILSETAEKVENYTAGLPHSAFWKTEQSVFDRLKSAVAASESIPGIIAEIDAMLPEGYCVTKREVQPAEDMSDWRNWIEGDLVRAISTSACGGYVEGMVYKIERFDHDIIYTERDGFQSDKNGWGARFFRFHSRPAKVAK